MKPSRGLLWCGVLTAILVVTGACGPKASPDIPSDTPDRVAPAQPDAKDSATDITDKPKPALKDEKPRLDSMEIRAADDEARKTGLIGDVYFDFDKYDLKPEARERLAKNAEFMKGDGKKFVVEIQGHCDERGTNDYNIALADRRANAALEYMVTLGVQASRLKTVSFGEERPSCTDHNESCWWKNRRGEFHLTQ